MRHIWTFLKKVVYTIDDAISWLSGHRDGESKATKRKSTDEVLDEELENFREYVRRSNRFGRWR